jgi:Family of unknown function (DUF6152)
MRTWSLIVVLSALLATGPVLAHHSFAAEYDRDATITLKGAIVKMAWTNPHSWLYITAPGPDGKVMEWAIEFGTPNTLFRRGWTRSSLPVGVEVTVNGFRAKDGSNKVNAETVVLPNGQRLFAGSSGTGAPSDDAR